MSQTTNNTKHVRAMINRLVRQDVLTMVPYQSARREQVQGNCWLNANEAGGNKQLQIQLQNLNRYPDFQPAQLLNAYSAYANVDEQQLLATRGADEGIEVLIRTFCRANQDQIVVCPPTYGMYAISAKAHAITINTIALKDNLQLDIERLQEFADNNNNNNQQSGSVKLVFICSPNNPTGDVINREDIINVIEMFSSTALVVVDEAYIEFCPELTMANLIDRYPNLVVLRTLSKAFALAGLRCGFTLANAAIIEMMAKIIAPYPISAPVSLIASEALSNQLPDMLQRVEQVLTLKAEINSFLDQQPWLIKRFLSKTNYVLFKAENATELFEFLGTHGVLIRNQSSQLNLQNCLRISIGDITELQQFKDCVLQYNKQIDVDSKSQLSESSKQSQQAQSPPNKEQVGN